MFDMISYAVKNKVSVEVYSTTDILDGFIIKIRDLYTAAQESTTIRYTDLHAAEDQDAYIESRCDALLSSIGKSTAEHDRRKRASAHMRTIWEFFKSPGNGIMRQ